MIIPVFLLQLLFSVVGGIQKEVPASPAPLEISHLTGDLYVYTTYQTYQDQRVPSNSMYLVTDQGVVLVDVPWDTGQIEPLLDSISTRHQKKVVMSISTHWHEDRTSGLNIFREKGIRTYSTQKTYELSLKNKKELAQFQFHSDTTFTIGQYQLETYYGGEGHTTDNIVVYFKKDQVLFGGCAVKDIEATDLGNIQDANLDQWPLTIRNFQDRFSELRYVIPGHGSGHSPEALVHTLNLLDQHP